ncbi:MAG: M20/M25/M40 family metallo-hydrolase [Deltaproteobacteria bacterium]|nr:M20/M25/M40 family metallo-hydrolase [Deltaproteobacteria bacterium]
MANGVSRERLTALFLELVRIDSLSRKEHLVADRLARELVVVGAEVWTDDAGTAVGGTTGNVLARVKGSADVAPLLLSAHMDTVIPGEGVQPIVEGDVIRSDGRTVLGGDDKSGCAIICEVLRVLRDEGIPHGDIEVAFTICEEVGLLGAKHLDVRALTARAGLVLDSDAPGYLFTRAPASNHLVFTVHGLEAHAGMAPERGINAIQVAAEGVAAMKLGRIDDETTANIGVVTGGGAVNVVPNRVRLEGEARSHDAGKLAAQSDHMRAALEAAAARHVIAIDGEERRARVETIVEQSYEAMNVPDAAPIVQLVLRAAAALGHGVESAAMGGGCDANVLNGRGFQVANLGTGMRDIHTVKEWLRVSDMIRTAEVIVEMLRLHAARDELL